MKNILKWFVAISMGFNNTSLKWAESIGKTEFWQVTIFIVLTVVLTIGWKSLLDWAYENY